MKIPCEMIQDVLPLYHDGVCSEVSRNLVEAHLEACGNCKAFLKTIDVEMEVYESELEAKQPLESIKKNWYKQLRRALLKGVAVTAMLVAVLMGMFLFATQVSFISAPAEDIKVSEVCLIEEGLISYRLDLVDGEKYNDWDFKTMEDGSFYMIPKRPLLNVWVIFWPELCHWNPSRLVDIAEENAYQQRYGEGIVITSAYVGVPGDAVLIWEEGMELPPASDEVRWLNGYE